MKLFIELYHNYLKRLVASAESEPPVDIDIEEYEAAIEVAELILE